MGSSSGDDYSTPPQQPAPPANLISPMGQSTNYQPHYINFLGDTNTPSTGLTPQMLSAINATNGPPPGAPPVAGGGARPDPGLTVEMQKQMQDQMNRQRMAEVFMQQNPTMQNFQREKMMKDRFGAGAPVGQTGYIPGGRNAR